MFFFLFEYDFSDWHEVKQKIFDNAITIWWDL